MSEPRRLVDVAEWVARAANDPIAHQQRQTVHVVLSAIAATSPLDEVMILKGGILMGLAYGSLRQTADVDLTAAASMGDGAGDTIRQTLNPALPRAAAQLGYAGLSARVHSIKPLPKGQFETARFPALKVKVRAVRQGQMETYVDVDISFNEPTGAIDVLELIDGDEILAYSLEDLIAEKYRAMLQQVVRRRNRRQDVYDLHLLIAEGTFDAACRKRILDALLVKCRARDIEPTRNSLGDPEVRERSGADWPTMELEVGALPEFEPCFARVSKFYQDLPWEQAVTELKAMVSAP